MKGQRVWSMATSWNHNIHYHPLILGVLPRRGEQVLDVGCGEGILARQLSERFQNVRAIDRDATTIELARQHRTGENVEYIIGDFLTYPFEPDSFDAVVSVAALHHMGTVVGLERMRELLRPGGALAVVGLARSHYPADLPMDLAGAIATRVHRLTKTYQETSAPKVWPPPETFSEVRRSAQHVLPRARFRRHVLWRYSLVWHKPFVES